MERQERERLRQEWVEMQEKIKSMQIILQYICTVLYVPMPFW